MPPNPSRIGQLGRLLNGKVVIKLHGGELSAHRRVT